LVPKKKKDQGKSQTERLSTLIKGFFKLQKGRDGKRPVVR